MVADNRSKNDMSPEGAKVHQSLMNLFNYVQLKCKDDLISVMAKINYFVIHKIDGCSGLSSDVDQTQIT